MTAIFTPYPESSDTLPQSTVVTSEPVPMGRLYHLPHGILVITGAEDALTYEDPRISELRQVLADPTYWNDETGSFVQKGRIERILEQGGTR
jgi:hypothetical protein